MSLAGRPLRFLLAVMTGWATVRAVMLWPVPPRALVANANVRSRQVPTDDTLSVRPVTAPVFPGATPLAITSLARRNSHQMFVRSGVVYGAPLPVGTNRPVSVARATSEPAAPGSSPVSLKGAVQPITSPAIQPGIHVASSPGGSRWKGSFWTLVRGGSTAPQAGLTGGVLGGSQAGVRLGYALGKARRVVAYGRISGALSQPGREAAVGIDWRPAKPPIHLIAEQRFPLDGGRGGFTLGLVGGTGPSPLPAGFRLETYGEAGVILRQGGVAFADGAARISRQATSLGPVRFTLGAGAWGAAQPGAARLDVGPAVAADIAVHNRNFRLSLDWRQRVAGDARPAAGIALTLGADF